MATDNKRIARNTAFLYLRMILVMGVTLYTSRIVLEELGASDFGVYTVVGGVVAMFAFINSSMTTATQRYLNIELGRGNAQGARDVFSTALTVHATIAVIALILGETIGLWFVNHKLVIPPDSMFDANVVYQSAILSFVVSIMQVPFNSAIIANERMNMYAYISILEVVLKLGTAFLLIWMPSNKLAYYGVFVLITHLLVWLMYVVYTVKVFPECRLRFVYIRNLFREMLGFAGWNLVGSLAHLVRTQGLSIVLNLFLGPLINAAKGIADQIQNAVNQFNSSFQVAMNPQITKNYAAQAYDEMQMLAYRGIKFSSILLVVLVLPICVNINTILHIWLTEVPDYTGLFSVLVLVDLVVSNFFGSPLIVSMASTGRIKVYQIVISGIWLLILPLSYVMLSMGMAPQYILYANIMLNFVAGVTRLWFCKVNIGYSYSLYIRQVFLPLLGVIVVSTVAVLMLKSLLFGADSLLNMLIVSAVSVVVTIAVSWTLALSNTERSTLIRMITSKLRKS